jgi:hypothetical protein
MGRSTSKRAKLRGRVGSVAFVFIGFQRAATMGLFLVLFWCAAVARAVHRYYSRFGIPNSRFGSNKFPFSRLRELAGKGSICLPFSVPEWRLSGTIEKIPGSMGITGNFATGETGGGSTCNGADPRRPRLLLYRNAPRR